jgi:hypothetical protein
MLLLVFMYRTDTDTDTRTRTRTRLVIGYSGSCTTSTTSTIYIVPQFCHRILCLKIHTTQYTNTFDNLNRKMNVSCKNETLSCASY